MDEVTGPIPLSDEPRYPDVTVPLVGEDGNAFAIISRVARALTRAHGIAAANLFTEEAMASPSYEDLLGLVMSTVEVE